MSELMNAPQLVHVETSTHELQWHAPTLRCFDSSTAALGTSTGDDGSGSS
jgi:hypothetical protein